MMMMTTMMRTRRRRRRRTSTKARDASASRASSLLVSGQIYNGKVVRDDTYEINHVIYHYFQVTDLGRVAWSYACMADDLTTGHWLGSRDADSTAANGGLAVGTIAVHRPLRQ
jgi:hypothetical protein